MTLTNQIKFVDDLIKEDPDTTIREYLEAVQEIDIIEKTCTDMPFEKITPEQEQTILNLAHTGDYKLIQQEAKVGLRTLYKYLEKAGISLKEIRDEKKAAIIQEKEEARLAAIKARQLPDLIPARKISSRTQEPYKRPAAMYSNLPSPYGIADSLHQQKTA